MGTPDFAVGILDKLAQQNLEIAEIQPEVKRTLSAKEFLAGFQAEKWFLRD
jgi:methionyl-tRNA formyltransferase